MNYHNITKADMLNGEGLRVVLWVAGCNHHCRGCQNPQTHDPKGGIEFDESAWNELMDALRQEYIQGLTLSGGDPLFPDNRETILKIVKHVKRRYKQDIWLYTGYNYEAIKDLEILKYVDVLVEGPFVKELKDENYEWAGSTNQRIIRLNERNKMRVKILSFTKDPFEKMYEAARTCYSKASIIDEDCLPENFKDLVQNVLKSGHLSIAEHVQFMISIEGISRAATHQLVRHRHCTFSQQSQRYVNMKDAKFIEPESILVNREADSIFNNTLEQIKNCYQQLVELGIKKEDARAILPNCTSTNIVMTLNLRELMHIANLRLCSRSQKEIRELFNLIKKEIKETVSKDIAELLQPQCEKLGYCPEEKSCGRKVRRGEKC